jgi:hypothetical protein
MARPGYVKAGVLTQSRRQAKLRIVESASKFSNMRSWDLEIAELLSDFSSHRALHPIALGGLPRRNHSLP